MTRTLWTGWLVAVALLGGPRPALAQDQVLYQVTNTTPGADLDKAPTLVVDGAHLSPSSVLFGQDITAQLTLDLTVIDEVPVGLSLEVLIPKSVVVSQGPTDYTIAVDTTDVLGNAGLDYTGVPGLVKGLLIGTDHPGEDYQLRLDLNAGAFTIADPAGTYAGTLVISLTAHNLDP